MKVVLLMMSLSNHHPLLSYLEHYNHVLKCDICIALEVLILSTLKRKLRRVMVWTPFERIVTKLILQDDGVDHQKGQDPSIWSQQDQLLLPS